MRRWRCHEGGYYAPKAIIPWHLRGSAAGSRLGGWGHLVVLPGVTAKAMTNPGPPAGKGPASPAWHTHVLHGAGCPAPLLHPPPPWKACAQGVLVTDHALLPGFYNTPKVPLGALGLGKDATQPNSILRSSSSSNSETNCWLCPSAFTPFS